MIVGLLAVALLWGVTNPFLKHYSRGIASRDSDSLWSDVAFLASRPGYLAALAVNLVGSVLFYAAMSSHQGRVSLVVPVCNALTFVVTAATGAALFGERVSARSLTGMGLIVAGVAVALA